MTAPSPNDKDDEVPAHLVIHCGTFDHEGRCGACAKKISELKQRKVVCPLGMYPREAE